MLSRELLNSWTDAGYEIWLFGTGEYGRAIYAYLSVYGAKIKGFVVSEIVQGGYNALTNRSSV